MSLDDPPVPVDVECAVEVITDEPRVSVQAVASVLNGLYRSLEEMPARVALRLHARVLDERFRRGQLDKLVDDELVNARAELGLWKNTDNDPIEDLAPPTDLMNKVRYAVALRGALREIPLDIDEFLSARYPTGEPAEEVDTVRGAQRAAGDGVEIHRQLAATRTREAIGLGWAYLSLIRSRLGPLPTVVAGAAARMRPSADAARATPPAETGPKPGRAPPSGAARPGAAPALRIAARPATGVDEAAADLLAVAAALARAGGPDPLPPAAFAATRALLSTPPTSPPPPPPGASTPGVAQPPRSAPPSGGPPARRTPASAGGPPLATPVSPGAPPATSPAEATVSPAGSRAAGPAARKRRRWTHEETEVFLDICASGLVGRWAAVQSRMERLLPIPDGVAKRSQVDLKDKWRNLKKAGNIRCLEIQERALLAPPPEREGEGSQRPAEPHERSTPDARPAGGTEAAPTAAAPTSPTASVKAKAAIARVKAAAAAAAAEAAEAEAIAAAAAVAAAEAEDEAAAAAVAVVAAAAAVAGDEHRSASSDRGRRGGDGNSSTEEFESADEGAAAPDAATGEARVGKRRAAERGTAPPLAKADGEAADGPSRRASPEPSEPDARGGGESDAPESPGGPDGAGLEGVPARPKRGAQPRRQRRRADANQESAAPAGTASRGEKELREGGRNRSRAQDALFSGPGEGEDLPLTQPLGGSPPPAAGRARRRLR